jgi:hypothetical protein
MTPLYVQNRSSIEIKYGDSLCFILESKGIRVKGIGNFRNIIKMKASNNQSVDRHLVIDTANLEYPIGNPARQSQSLAFK